MSKKIDTAVERVMEAFNDEGAPESMSKEQFVEFCEEIESQVKASREAVEEELGR